MITRCTASPDDFVLDVGSGASTLIPALLMRGHRNVAAVDISPEALRAARRRLRAADRSRVTWIVDDVLRPERLRTLASRVGIWHDRALLHFLTSDSDRDDYLKTLRELVVADGFVVIATFALEGVDRCSGLPVRRYNAEMISDFLGEEFELLHASEYLYVTPGGEPRPYVYTLFRRNTRAAAVPGE
jgi:SAM-dependent methyltransferase